MTNKKTSKTSKKVTTPLTTKLSNPKIEPFSPMIVIDEDALKDTAPKPLTHEQLLKALYYVFDFMDRAQMEFFVVGKTADAIKRNVDLYGDKITVGVRKNSWESGSRRIADSFAIPTKDSGETVEYEYEGVPILLYVLVDEAIIMSLDSINYAHEFFKLPNPYSEFLERFAWVK